MSHAKARNTFSEVLSGAASLKGTTINWENARASEKNVYPRLEPYLMPAGTNSVTLDNDLEEVVGVYQVTVVTELGKGTATSDDLVSKIYELFPCNTEYKDDKGFTLRVSSPVTVAKGSSIGETWKVSCWFNYTALQVTKSS